MFVCFFFCLLLTLPPGAEFYCLGYGQPTPWQVVQRIASGVNEIPIGYFKTESVLNPRADSTVTFDRGDRVIVLSENDQEHM